MKPLLLLAGVMLASISSGKVAAAQAPESPPPPQLAAPVTPVTRPAGSDPTALAKASQNPLTDLLILPLQFNFNMGGGLHDQTLLETDFQPLVPIKLTRRWNLISRSIVPMIDSPGTATTRYQGVGDIQAQIYLTRAKPGRATWGIGPIVSFPTATHTPSQTGSWAAGPAGVGLVSAGPWVVGAQASQLWAFADEGADGRETHRFAGQIFANYNFASGWALSSTPLITADWNAPPGQRWTVPVGLGLTRTTLLRKQALSLGLQYYRNVERPDAAALHQLRFTWAFLFPGKQQEEGRH